MKLPAVLLVVPLLAGAAFAGRASDAMRAAPRAAPGAASLLGGFTAIAVQVLWLRADKAVTESREDDALLAFAAINELEPQLVSSGDLIARSLGFNLAEGHADSAVRWSLGREGWRALVRTVALNPGDARALAARGRYALLRLSTDPPMHDGFVRDVDAAGPLESARRDYEEAVRLRPQWLEPWHGTALASMGRGVELVGAGKFDEAAGRLTRAADAFRHVADAWRAAGDASLAPSIETARDNAEVAGALAAVCSAPAADRTARYEELRGRFPDARLPDLPLR
jgi:tetratricopeptide (TPR) repeat protein